MPLVRSISGLRATIGDGLSPETIVKYTAAFAQLQKEGKIVVGMDGRKTGWWIKDCVIGALKSMNREIEFIGIAPTPTVQLLTEKTDAAGGISITASHNPADWNGLKFLDHTGVFLDGPQNTKLFEIVDNGIIYPTDYLEKSTIINNNVVQDHVSQVLKLSFINEELVAKIRSKKIKVAVDAVNASGSKFVPLLLDNLGFEVVELYCDNSGEFPHTPEPIPENLELLKQSIIDTNSDFGIAVDPDADRLVLLDSTGRAIGEEKTIVLCAKALIDSSLLTQGDNVTVNLSTSRMIDDLCSSKNITVNRSPVGEINVVGKMKENSSKFGGEGSGGVILPELHFGRDSLSGIALITLLLASSDDSFNTLVNSLPDYHIEKTKKEFTGDFTKLESKLNNVFDDVSLNKEDGLRFDFKDKWVQIRKSNTEPIIRIIAEAKSKEECIDLIEKIKSKI